MIGLFLGAYMPTRRSAALTITVIFIASYFGPITIGFVESLDSIKPYFLFTYFDTTADVFKNGVESSDVLTLVGISLVFFVLALLSFQRRNITAGAWPWQRARAQ